MTPDFPVRFGVVVACSVVRLVNNMLDCSLRQVRPGSSPWIPLRAVTTDPTPQHKRKCARRLESRFVCDWRVALFVEFVFVFFFGFNREFPFLNERTNQDVDELIAKTVPEAVALKIDIGLKEPLSACMLVGMQLALTFIGFVCSKSCMHIYTRSYMHAQASLRC